ncbi:MAG: zf-HC2 domain-containing protein [Devosia sp.]|nr:zf-HC2 domain-containing protein [Devosia sp.]
MMLKCREVSELASRYVDHDLGMMTRAQIRLHLMMCKHCTRYVRQLRQTVALLSEIAPREPSLVDDARFVALLKQRRR